VLWGWGGFDVKGFCVIFLTWLVGLFCSTSVGMFFLHHFVFGMVNFLWGFFLSTALLGAHSGGVSVPWGGLLMRCILVWLLGGGTLSARFFSPSFPGLGGGGFFFWGRVALCPLAGGVGGVFFRLLVLFGGGYWFGLLAAWFGGGLLFFFRLSCVWWVSVLRGGGGVVVDHLDSPALKSSGRNTSRKNQTRKSRWMSKAARRCGNWEHPRATAHKNPQNTPNPPTNNKQHTHTQQPPQQNNTKPRKNKQRGGERYEFLP